MDAAEVVVHVEQRDRVHMVVELFRERVSQTGEPPHVHPHGQILPLDMRRAHVRRVRVANNRIDLAADADGGAVTLLGLRVGAIELLQHGVVDVSAKGILDGRQIHLVAVRGELDSVRQSARHILQKLRGASGVARPNKPAQNELGVGINRDEGPRVASIRILRRDLRGDVLRLARDERPDFINLHATRRDVADGAVQIGGARRADIRQQAENRAFGNAGQARSRAHRAALDQRRDDRDPLSSAQLVHGTAIILNRFSMSSEKRRINA